MNIEKYNALAKMFGLNRNELQIFWHNYYDSFAFNEYLNNNINYIKLSIALASKLIDFFDENGIDDETRKKIIISVPMVFSCEDYEKQLHFVYKDSILEGIMIVDQNNISHVYRIKKVPRSITENISLVNNIVTTIDKDLKKAYYIRVKDQKHSERYK